jgi:hypothetical protein
MNMPILKNLSSLVRGVNELADKMQKMQDSPNSGANSGADSQSAVPTPAPVSVPSGPRTYDLEAAPQVKSQFSSALKSNFSQYEIRESVPVSELGGEGKPYDFGLYQNGQAVAMVLIAHHSRTKNRPFRNSLERAAAAGIPVVVFYDHLPNEAGYVAQRIKEKAKI